ncbi:MAG: RDD family protein [Pseudomonadales bacterium]|nr:RDD family protein [Pseudomonadales bacterium]
MGKSKRKNASFKSRSNTNKSQKSAADSVQESTSQPSTPVNYSECPSAPLWRRLGSIVYDQLVLWAIWIATGFMHAAIFGIESTKNADQLTHTLFPMLLGATFLFYYWFWTHGGQTLGMRAWRLKVIDGRLDGTPPHFVKCLLRFMGAFFSISAFGLGYVWVLFDPNKDTWHDRISGTRTLVVPKEENKKNRFKDSRRIPKDPV